MVESHTTPTPRPRLVGQSLLYAISVFASLGVFLVSLYSYPTRWYLTYGSSDMTKGKAFFSFDFCIASYSNSVMSGIITGPHFRKYFNYPGPLDIGTMVAVLEVGAFGAFLPGISITRLKNRGQSLPLLLAGLETKLAAEVLYLLAPSYLRSVVLFRPSLLGFGQ